VDDRRYVQSHFVEIPMPLDIFKFIHKEENT
jgi:hypothetical protein